MKNFEKYEIEIKELNYNFAFNSKLNKLCKCQDIECDNCLFRKTDLAHCGANSTRWLYEEYKEPLLTDEEREYLKAVIKPFRNKVKGIGKAAGTYAYLSLEIQLDDGLHYADISLNSFDGSNLKFNRLTHQYYSLEELGL